MFKMSKLASCVVVTATAATSAQAATAVWQGGDGNFSDANWTVDASPNQVHGDFASEARDTTINSGTVAASAFALTGDDSFTLDGASAVLNGTGDFEAGGSPFTVTNGAAITMGSLRILGSGVEFGNGSVTLNSSNPFRTGGGVSAVNSMNITADAGGLTLTHTDLSGSDGQDLAGKVTIGFFRLDGTYLNPTTEFDGTNIAAINAELASAPFVVNGK